MRKVNNWRATLYYRLNRKVWILTHRMCILAYINLHPPVVNDISTILFDIVKSCETLFQIHLVISSVLSLGVK